MLTFLHHENLQDQIKDIIIIAVKNSRQDLPSVDILFFFNMHVLSVTCKKLASQHTGPDVRRRREEKEEKEEKDREERLDCNRSLW